ncbi:MAG: ribonuclease III [Bacteroidetes bacterium]|nr:ribonuclease III [Bacteroidota bacterium]
MPTHPKLKNIISKIGELLKPFKFNISEFKALEETLNYKIKSKKLFILALTHSSVIQKNKAEQLSSFSNERLEFLGDAVLSLEAAKFLYKNYPKASEGFMTVTRSKLVSKVALIKYGEKLQLTKFIKIHPKLSFSNRKGINTVISDAFEAIVGAIFLDSGEKAVTKFVQKFFESSLSDYVAEDDSTNFKSKLLETLQSKKMKMPIYKLINSEGPDHSKTFFVEVLINDFTQGQGTGSSKKEAEQNAAKVAYDWLLKETN